MYRLALGGLLTLALLVYWFSRGGDAAPTPVTPPKDPAQPAAEAVSIAAPAEDDGAAPLTAPGTSSKTAPAGPLGAAGEVSGEPAVEQLHIGEPLNADDPFDGYTEAAQPQHIGEPLDAERWPSRAA